MQEELINKILADIYLIDEELRKDEKNLKQIISELLANKPATNFDANFSLRLRKEVLERVHEMESLKQSEKNNFNILNIFSMKKAYYIGGGALVLVILAVAVLTIYPKKSAIVSFNNQSKKSSEVSIDLRNKISRVDSNAFGSLIGSALNSVNAENQMAINNIGAPARAGFAAGMGGREMSTATMDTKIAPDMIMPPMSRYSYVYQGEDFELPSNGDVYKKVTQAGVGSELADRLSGNFNLINLNNFQNKVLTNFSISEDRDYGYILYFDMQNNTVSINQNWAKWPQPYQDCKDDACYRNLQMKITDIPEDAELIQIANQAIADYGIDVSMYGKPRVNNQWRISYELSQDKENYYIPDTLSVVYPISIDGKEVVDDYGNYAGISVDVSIRYKKMSAINGLSASEFQASSYALETDKERIMKFAKQGGLWPGYIYFGGKEQGDIALGTPSFGLISNWKYDPATGRGEEYYIPAIIFPITGKTDDIYFNRRTVSIPLLKDLLDEAEKNNNEVPVPLYRAADTGATEPAKIESSVETKVIQ